MLVHDQDINIDNLCKVGRTTQTYIVKYNCTEWSQELCVGFYVSCNNFSIVPTKESVLILPLG